MIDEYQSRPWSQPRDVKVADGAQLCQVPDCTKPAGDAFVCAHCLDDLDVALGNVPGLLDDLQIMQARQHRLHVVQRPRTLATHTRWDDALRPVERAGDVDQGRLLAGAGYNRRPDVAAAGAALSTLANAVTSAVRALTEHRGIRPPVMDAARASRWLLSNLGAVALDPAGPDIVVEVVRETKRSMTVIDRADDRVYIGLCGSCGTAMHADAEQPEYRCQVCSATYFVADCREAIRSRLLESLLSLSEIAALSAADPRHFGGRVRRKQLEGWVRRGRLVKAGVRPQPTLTGPDPALYRAGDVLALVGERVSE